jgi:hypothetical protein
MVELLKAHLGMSQTRDAILHHIHRNGFCHPQRNLEQQEIAPPSELHEIGLMQFNYLTINVLIITIVTRS